MSDDREIVEWIDPDWRDHFPDVGLAAEFYRQYAPVEWAEAAREME